MNPEPPVDFEPFPAASAVPVPLPVTGPLTDNELRAAPVEVTFDQPITVTELDTLGAILDELRALRAMLEFHFGV